MSTRRLAVTTLAMALIGVLLGLLGPDVAGLREALTHPQSVADAGGPDTVVLAWAATLAWAVWVWGALGLGLTAATAVPGLLGRTARALLRLVLPAAARRAAAVALGIGLGVGIGAPVFASAAPATVAVSAPDWPADGSPVPAAPDWPTAVPADPAPDWPAPGPGTHVVVRGDCLWDIAAARLASGPGSPPTDGQIADAVHAWWTTNASVIGPDPDLLLPGQVLQLPGLD
jgi:nucleoid-associated protein YgaU